MKDYLTIENEPGYVKDPYSSAILYNDLSGLAEVKQKRKLGKLRQKSFRELGYRPTHVKMRNKPGSGLHSGAFLFNGIFNYGRCPGAGIEFNNVHFLGASTLPSIPAGPITFVALINCIYTVRRVVKDLMT